MEAVDSGHWSADKMRERLTKLLKPSETLSKSLDVRLAGGKPTPKKKAAQELHERVAARIIALGTGLRAARTLVEACFMAVLGKDADAAAERGVARELLCEWLPYGYPEVVQVVILRFEKHPPDRRNLEMTTPYEHFVEVHMARLDGRRCLFTTTRIDSRGGKSVAESMFPVPPGSPQRRSAAQVADLVVQVVGERFTIRSKVDAASRISTEAMKGKTPYLVVPATQRPGGFPDAAIRKLNTDFPELHVVVLTTPGTENTTSAESMLWTHFIDLLGEGG